MGSGPMDDRQAREQAAREATLWFVRLSNPVAREQDRQDFRAWLAANPLNADAIAETRDLWMRLEQPAARLGADGWHRRAPRPRFRALQPLPLAAAIGAFAILLGGLVWRDAGFFDRLRADHATRPGQHYETVLADGTRLYLDGGSAVKIRLGPSRREIEILRGRVYFDVARDETRPFRIAAGEVGVEVLGTAFDVDEDFGRVTVERGLVAVSDITGTHERLTRDERIEMSGGHLGAKTQVSAETALAWRRGLIVLDAAPLRRVAEELQRMAPGRLVIADRELADLTLTGVFRADNPDAVLEAMRSALGLKTLSVPGFATLVYR